MWLARLKTQSVLFGESRKYEFRRSSCESTSGNKKEGHTAHSTAKPTAATYLMVHRCKLGQCGQIRHRNHIRGNDDGSGGPGVSYVCPHCHCFPVEDCIWWDTTKCNWWCAACGGQYDWRAPNRSWSCKTASTTEKQQFFGRTRHCEECVTIESMH